MKRLLWITGLLMLAGLAAYAAESNTRYSEGEHFLRISPAVPTSAQEGNVEVVELFWYGCPHCYSLEPHLEIWLDDKPENVTFTRIPSILNPRWETHARTFYTLELMGKLDSMHSQMFSALHEEGKRLNDKEAIADYLAKQGVDKKEFLKTFDSFAVATRIQRAKQLSKAYGANGVPTIIVDGKFRTSASIAGGYNELTEVMNYLIEDASSK